MTDNKTDAPIMSGTNSVQQRDGFQAERELMHRQMLSAVSHDLKTPLASVIGSLEIYERLGKQLPDAKKETLIHTALTEAYRLDSFLTNILDMAKLEGNLVPLRRENANIRDVLDNTVSNMTMRLKGANVTVNGPVNLTGNLDPALLSRAVNLLLDNAVKHTKPGVAIDISFKKLSDDQLQIDVSDDGPGVPQGKEEEIFSKYTRLSRGDHQNAGTGLGLAIARLVVEKLGGTIIADNPENGGARFRLQIAI